ncbi:MAG: tRNA-dihydrouridine synthase family protein [DPANN group archaeon]|nr:tRNA-dihydrouridine synthase family protein [DPANN group archaeon]
MNNKFSYMLAPIEAMTDSCFRTICASADLTFTEKVSIEALVTKNVFALEKIKFFDDTPCAIQLIGQREEALKSFLSYFLPEKGFKGFNLNLGCPDPTFVSKGLGCAMIKRVSKMKRFVDIINDHGYSASIKMRLGLNQHEKEKKVYLNLINGVDADFFVVHARHGGQTYKDKADLSVFKDCVATGKNIIANGDIATKEDVERLKDCSGVMISRAAIKNPLIFTELKGLSTPPLSEVMNRYLELAKERESPLKYRNNILKHIINDESKTMAP